MDGLVENLKTSSAWDQMAILYESIKHKPSARKKSQSSLTAQNCKTIPIACIYLYLIAHYTLRKLEAHGITE